MIYGNAVMAPTALKTVTLEDTNGNSYTGVVTGEQVIFTANPSDIKIGKTAAIDGGIVEGTDTKTYRTCMQNYLILPGDAYSIPLPEYDRYNYTQFNCMIAKFNNEINDSTAVEKIVLNDHVYNTNSTEALSTVIKNSTTKSIDLNMINDTEYIYIVYILTYKEEG